MATSAWMHGAAAMRLTEGLVSVLKEQRPEYLSEVLTNYREHGVFPTQGASDVAGLVGFCNAKLSSSKTRLEGLCLLSMLVKDSSSDLFQQHCLSWLRSLQQVIQSQAPCQSIQLAVSILQDLLQYSCQLAELAREVGLNSILGILMSLLGLKTECEHAAMEGMRACMVYYPRACGSLKDKLGAYFLSKMDSTSRKTQEMACQGYSLLPCLGGLADRSAGTGRAEGWTNQIQCLLASANGILAQIYQGSETDEAVQYRGPGVELPFPHLDQTDPLLLLQLQHRYTAVCLVLKHTLRADPASAVHLPVRPILNLVCRALAVNSRNTSLTADGSLRLLVLPSVHISTLEVLAELITVVRSGMVQYAAVLQKLFSQMLCAWTAVPEANVGQQRAYSSVRVSVYRTLELWLQLVGASANVLQGASSHAELLFTHLLADITPGAESIKLRAGLSADVVPGGKPGPRRTKQLVMADPVGASLQRKGDPVSNQDTCLSALKVLRRIIQTSGTLLKNDIHKRLHEVVLPLCVRLQQQQTSSITACESVGGVSGQYSSALTRRQLYRLLLALVLVPSPCWPPPLTCTVSILSNGRLDRNLKVSSFCSEALTICNSLLHPRVPSIALPLPPLALKPPPTASVLSGPGPAPRLTLPTLLGGPAPGPPFPGRHPLSLGPNSLLGSLENHLSLVPGMPGPASAPGDLLLSPHGQPQPDPAGLGLPDGQRPVFVRYDKEEAEDVEISLASDSDDSVVIVPPGMLGAGSQLDDPAPGSQNLLSAGAGAGVPLPGGDTVTMVPSTAAPASLDVTSLPNDLVPTSSTPTNSFPSSSGSVVSLVTSLTPGSARPPAGGLADPVAVKPQLQQMLLQPPAQGPQGPPGSVALPLQVQLQNQLAQQGRHLHQHPPPAPPSNQDSAVININSTDDEDEDEEDMEDDEELEEEEEEDGLDEEEEGSEDFYEGEEYEDFDDEEAEELEEEEEDEDGDMPPLEGSEDKSEEVTMEEEEEEEEEEEKALGAEEEEGEGAGFNPEGGIEELQSSRALFGEERMKVQEVESIGVLEEARGGDRGDGEDDSERMDDPSMPQILCVTGGALEERADSSQEAAQAAGELQDQLTLWDQNHQQNPPTGASEEEPTAHSQEESVAEREQEAGVREEVALEAELQEEEEPVVVQEEAAAGASGGEETPAAPHDPQQDQTDTQQGYETQAEWTKPVGEQGEKEEESNTEEEEEKGMKRKREEEVIEDEARPSPEKKKQDDEAMASMLADFIACPPDDEDVASGSNQS